MLRPVRASPRPDAGDSRAGTPVRVVVAITAAERELFFATAQVPLAALPVRLTWIDPTTLAPGGWGAALAAADPEVLVSGWTTPPLPADWLADASCRLAYVCHLTGSVRRLVPRSFLDCGGRVTNWGELAAASVAEQALLLALAALRDLGAWRACLALPAAQRRWDSVPTRPLHGARVGLHGFGAIARRLVALLRPFGVSLRAYSPGVPADFVREHGVEPAAALIEVFRDRDVVFECEALTPATAGTVTAAELGAMPVGAVFVNVGRGRVVDEEALVAAAQSGRIRVAVDVVANEPVHVDAPLCRIPGVIVSPHIGGPTVAEYPRCGDAAVANLRRYLAGDPLEAEVTPAIYDRST